MLLSRNIGRPPGFCYMMMSLSDRVERKDGLARMGVRRIQQIVVPCVLLTAALSGCAREIDGEGSDLRRMTILTFNVRYDNPADGEHAWPLRRDRVAALIRFHDADIAGLQEAQKNQIDDLVERLPGYRWYGLGRDDGEAGGEFVPIFYRSDRVALADSGTFWLSPTPQVPGSLGWDAAITRITTWGRFSDRETGKSFFVYNAHFDHVGEESREESARLLKSRVSSRSPKLPAVVLGDFNAEPGSAPYQVMADSAGGPILVDARERAEIKYGPTATFHGFEVGSSEPRRIDYIFLTPDLIAVRFGVLSGQEEGRYPSDHLPVLVEVEMP